jgi:hypothetical protein
MITGLGGEAETGSRAARFAGKRRRKTSNGEGPEWRVVRSFLSYLVQHREAQVVSGTRQKCWQCQAGLCPLVLLCRRCRGGRRHSRRTETDMWAWASPWCGFQIPQRWDVGTDRVAVEPRRRSSLGRVGFFFFWQRAVLVCCILACCPCWFLVRRGAGWHISKLCHHQFIAVTRRVGPLRRRPRC